MGDVVLITKKVFSLHPNINNYNLKTKNLYSNLDFFVNMRFKGPVFNS